jgi:hypothetical protein
MGTYLAAIEPRRECAGRASDGLCGLKAPRAAAAWRLQQQQHGAWLGSDVLDAVRRELIQERREEQFRRFELREIVRIRLSDGRPVHPDPGCPLGRGRTLIFVSVGLVRWQGLADGVLGTIFGGETAGEACAGERDAHGASAFLKFGHDESLLRTVQSLKNFVGARKQLARSPLERRAHNFAGNPGCGFFLLARNSRFGRARYAARREALARREAGETLMDIARSYGVSHPTISRL